MIQHLTPKKFSGWKPETTHQLPASGMPTCLDEPKSQNPPALPQELPTEELPRSDSQTEVLSQGEKMWHDWGVTHNFKWGGNELGNFFFVFFLLGGTESSAVFWISVVVKSDHVFFGSATHGWVGLVHDIFQMQLPWSTNIVCQFAKDFQSLNRPMVDWRLLVPVSSQRLLGFLVTTVAPYRLQRAPEISGFHQAKLYDDDAETDLASEYSRPVFKIPEWNTNRGTWSF